MVVQGWEQPHSHGTGSGAGPPRMLQPDYQGRAHRQQGDLAVPPTGQPHAPPWHQLLSLAGQDLQGVCWHTRHGFSGSVPCSHQGQGKTKHGIRPPHGKTCRVLTSPHTPPHGTMEGLGCQGGCNESHGMCPHARPGDDTMSLTHITPSPPITARNGQTKSRLQLPCWIHTPRSPGSFNTN